MVFSINIVAFCVLLMFQSSSTNNQDRTKTQVPTYFPLFIDPQLDAFGQMNQIAVKLPNDEKTLTTLESDPDLGPKLARCTSELRKVHDALRTRTECELANSIASMAYMLNLANGVYHGCARAVKNETDTRVEPEDFSLQILADLINRHKDACNNKDNGAGGSSEPGRGYKYGKVGALSGKAVAKAAPHVCIVLLLAIMMCGGLF